MPAGCPRPGHTSSIADPPGRNEHCNPADRGHARPARVEGGPADPPPIPTDGRSGVLEMGPFRAPRWLRSARRGWVRSGPKVASSRSGSANPRRLRRSSGASSCPLSPCGRRPGRGVASPGRSGSRFEGHRRCDVPSPRAEDGFVLRRASGFVPPGGSMARWLGRSIVVGSWSGLRGSGDDRRDQASLLDIFRGRGIGPAHNLPTGREALERDGPSGGQSGPPGRVVGPGNLPEGGPR